MTRAEQRMIRGYYPYMELRFRVDGSVEARQRPGGAWGLLYTAEAAERHIRAVRARDAVRMQGGLDEVHVQKSEDRSDESD